MPQNSTYFNLLPLAASQVSGNGASLHPQAAAPATRTGVVRVQARRSEAGVFRLNRSIRVSEGASIVGPHRGAEPLSWGGRRAGKNRGLGPKSPRLKRANGWFVTIVGMGGISQR